MSLAIAGSNAYNAIELHPTGGEESNSACRSGGELLLGCRASTLFGKRPHWGGGGSLGALIDWGWGGKLALSEEESTNLETKAEPQQIVAQGLLSCLQYPVP